MVASKIHKPFHRTEKLTIGLQETKAGLDLEIGMFRCLVATEEERLGLKPGD